MKMQKFNLEKALSGSPVVTRGGLLVEKIVSFGDRVFHPLVVNLKGYDSIYQVGRDGVVPKQHSFPYHEDRNQYDLFMMPVKRTVFVNIYAGLGTAGVFDTVEAAKQNATGNTATVIATAVPVEVEE